MARRSIPSSEIEKYIHLKYTLGLTRRQACKESGISETYAKTVIDRGMQSSSSEAFKSKPQGGKPKGPDDLSPAAADSLADFEVFRRRFFGHVSTPWQVEAAVRVRELLESDHKEYLVVNCPPGSGKTTLFTHDIGAWLTCRDRALRGVLGAHTLNIASRYTSRLKRSFERRQAPEAKDDERVRGLAVDAESTLVADFGRFKPEVPEIWTREQFTVEQFGDTPVDEKETTWVAFGQDSGQLGWRADLIVWDDLVVGRTLRSPDAVEAQQQWFEDEAETRLEPGGLLVLQGQRLGANDLYRHCLDMAGGDLDELDVDDDADLSDRPPKYHHIVFKAHYEDRCEGVHRPSEARPYPDGCLLDPVRLPWRELARVRANRGEKYEVVYQQGDVDPANVLVPKLWVTGGRDPGTGEVLPGCWDDHRELCQAPSGLEPPVLSIATADPSPTKFWSVQWWLHQPATGMWWLMDLLRQAMDAPDFLEWYLDSQSYGGVMESWQRRSVELGHPITAWVVEQNAAQRYLLQHDYLKRWMALHGVRVIGHETHANKADAEMGVRALLRPAWHHGRVRLPGAGEGRVASLKLVDEVTRWPGSPTDDCVMAEWFAKHRAPSLVEVDVSAMPKLRRPSWVWGQDQGPSQGARVLAGDRSGRLVGVA